MQSLLRRTRPLAASLVIFGAGMAVGSTVLATPGSAAPATHHRMVVSHWSATQVPGGAETVSPGHVKSSFAACPAPQIAISGGWVAHGQQAVGVMSVTSSHPVTDDLHSWDITVVNPSGAEGDVTFTPYAICAKVNYTEVLAP